MNHVLFTFLIFLLGIQCNFDNCYAQVKIEREFRIKASTVPQKAKDFIRSIDKDASVKWIKEESQTGISIEAKFKSNKKSYSVEFDTSGVLLDLEYIIYWETIDLPTQDEIENYLNEKFDRYSIEKIQVQLTGNKEAILQQLKDEGKDAVVHYELVVLGIIEEELHSFEILFNDEGIRVLELKFERRNTDNLDY